MLAVCTSGSLVLLDPSTLKKAPSSVPPTLSLSSIPTASTWAPDNSALFVAQEGAIHRYDSTGTSLGSVSTESTAGSITALVSKDKGDTLIFGDRDGVTVVDANSGRVAVRLDTHTAPVSGLVLAQDAALLVSIARDSVLTGSPEVHVHNLATASHVELQGLPKKADVSACAFHTHSKSKLLLAVGTQLLVYDVTKPTAPLRTIQLDKKSGEAVAIACSPFSKTLVAVGCNSGVVNLVDLDKEKGLFRTLPLEGQLTSLVFSPEGAALYGGAEDGRVLVLDLRALDKPAKSITVNSDNERIICMAVQRKLKPGESPRLGVRTSATALGKRRAGAEPLSSAAKALKAGPSTTPASPSALLKARPLTTSRTTLSPGPSPGRTRTISATSATPVKPSAKSKVDSSKSTPPAPRTRPAVAASAEQAAPPPAPPPMRVRTVSGATSASSRGTSSVSSRVTRVSSSTSATSVAPGTSEARANPSAATSSLSPTFANARARLRAVPSRSSTTTVQARTQTHSRHSPSVSPIPPVPALPEAYKEQLTEIDIRLRTPSPEPPSDDEAYTPILARRRDKGKGREPERPKTNVLGLGTPELRKWIQTEVAQVDDDDEDTAAAAAQRRVDFLEVPPNELRIQSIQVTDEDDAARAPKEGAKATIQMTVQVSPRRAPAAGVPPSWGLLPSLFGPARSPSGAGPEGASSRDQSSPAHELLQSLIRDAMYDFRRETKTEILGLHLDLVRMGRGWRKEMREALEQWGEQLKEVRRENELLRKENERLRRGY
ncbi:hypothetical protein PHLGIDRAFT_21101 [Phlebiopsis gigantea 11061_1 CR5-6]|uniref:Anaphase-promoting complex subunit 4 WD40 domain-containing protein n=1 Tax=Phlebiopsis gigantea (strain 11061_1 CR5-6) TaxID=745531 RepID=A0A0C3SFL4_PHLG1|nr:hypothetical protein PHLGIDRAFT_21101 [Phlebiopsis gigantea 11061_1 CR5-6]